MANPTRKPDTELMDWTGLALKASQFVDADGNVLLGGQGSNVAPIVTTNMDDGSADNTLIALDTATGTYDATEASNIEKNFDKLADTINEIITALETAGLLADA